ncbi:MAG: dihydroorotase [Dysgonamonadaceae bacterium]|jgi:dihydroorotase|nr:dihydroorotase [Dysgonamonadaceae bacterium]
MYLIKNALVINEGKRFKADVLTDGERIAGIWREGAKERKRESEATVIDAEGMLLLPGIIDDQVHFREPGLTHKADIHSESRAGLAGGVTSFIDMPNTVPQTVTVEALNAKFDLASQKSMANYSFMLGATNDNLAELKKPGAERAAAIKVFMGASTGNMLVDNELSLERIFAEVSKIVVTHCESESVIAANKARLQAQYGDISDIKFHPLIRDAEACYASSAEAVRLAEKHNSRLHLFHLSTRKELSLLDDKPLEQKRITAEVCVHHLWFSDKDYERLGSLIKWNPAVKSRADREALRVALLEGKIDVVATDHAPHTLEDKGFTGSPNDGRTLNAASGGPMIQHSLVAMLELCRQGIFTEELTVEKMAHNPARLFGFKDRGFIREGYYADLVLVNPNSPWTVSRDNILYKCGWSPLEGAVFSHQVDKTFVNGRLVYDNGLFDEDFRGKELELC